MMSGGESLLRLVGGVVVRRSASRLTVRCLLDGHDDRRASAVVYCDSGVYHCSSCGTLSPFDLLERLGYTRAEAVEVLIAAGLRDDRAPDRGRRREPRNNSGLSRRTPQNGRTPAVRRVTVAEPARAATELPADVEARLAAAVADRRPHDARLLALRAVLPGVLDSLGVGVARAEAFGVRSAAVRDAARELRLSIPLRQDGRLVGAILAAPNPSRRSEPHVLAVPGSRRVPLSVTGAPVAMCSQHGVLLVTEGEIDSLTAASCGIPALGVPGVGSRRAHVAAIAARARELGVSVLVVPDGDGPGRAGGRELAELVAAAGVPTVYADVLEDGHDVGSFLHARAQAATGTNLDRCYAAGRALLHLTGTEDA